MPQERVLSARPSSCRVNERRTNSHKKDLPEEQDKVWKKTLEQLQQFPEFKTLYKPNLEIIKEFFDLRKLINNKELTVDSIDDFKNNHDPLVTRPLSAAFKLINQNLSTK